MAIDYKSAGVDIAAGDALVDWLKSNQPDQWPHQNRLVSGIGGFSALFRADFKEMRDPCLVSSTDGIGTKLKVAVEFDEYEGVAQDLVAMCVNDLICCGAQPLFFLDYFATGQLDLKQAKAFLGGIQKACIEADCALIGGETAEMPGVYQGRDFDAAGFSVGVVDREKVLGSHKVQENDVILGVNSSGFHSNGFSLIRKVFAEDLSAWKEDLLTPTALYVKLSQTLLLIPGIRALANITGGGMDNILRVLPSGHHIELNQWEVPKPFLEVKKRAGLSWRQLLSTLNCGIGLAVVVDPNDTAKVIESCRQHNFNAIEIATVKAGNGEEKTWTLSPEWENENG